MIQELEDIIGACRVGFGAYVGGHELVKVDTGPREHWAMVLGWNNIPTVYVQRIDNKMLEEVEPWRIKKIQKQA